MCPSCRRGSQLPAQFVNPLGIEHDIVRLKESPNRRFVQLHLEAADADGAVADLSVLVGGFLVGLNAGDAGGGHGVEIDRHLELVASPANVFGKQLDAGRAGGDYHGSAIE